MKKALSLLLVLLMVLTMLPAAALATEGEDVQEAPVEEVIEAAAEEILPAEEVAEEALPAEEIAEELPEEEALENAVPAEGAAPEEEAAPAEEPQEEIDEEVAAEKPGPKPAITSAVLTVSEYEWTGNNIAVNSGAANLTVMCGNTKLNSNQYELGRGLNSTYMAKDPGTYTFKVSGKGAYSGEITVTWSIVKKQYATVTAAPTAAELTYSGAEQQLLATAGTAENGSLRYALGNENGMTEERWHANASSILGQDAGTYYVWYYVKGNEGYENSEPQCIQVTIHRKEVTVTWDKETFTYNGENQSPKASFDAIGEDVIKPSYSYRVIGKHNSHPTDSTKNAGKYKVTLTGIDNQNYKLPEEGLVKEFTIEQLEAVLTWDETTFTYNEHAQRPEATVSNAVKGDRVNVTDYELSAQKGSYLSIGRRAVNAGSYTITATELDNGNYKLPETATQDFTIEQGELVVYLKTDTFTYNGEIINVLDENNLVVKANGKKLLPVGNYPGPGQSGYLVVTDEETDTKLTSAKNAGEYSFRVYYVVDGNYASPVTVKWTINPRQLDVKWGETEFTYTGLEQAPTAWIYTHPERTYLNVVDGDEVNVAVSGAKIDSCAKAGVESYTAQATLTGKDAANYVIEEKDQTCAFTIAKADLTVTDPALVTGLTYNGKDQALLANAGTVTGVNGETGGTMWYFLVKFGASVTAPPAADAEGWTTDTATLTGKDAKNYALYFKVLADNANYNDYTKGKLEETHTVIYASHTSIAKALVNVTASAKDKVVDGSKKAELKKLTVTGMAEGEELIVDPASLSLSFAKKDIGKNISVTLDADKAKVSVKVGDQVVDPDNYEVEFASDAGTADINPVPAKPASKPMPPKTGDDAQLGLWISLMGVSVLALGAVVISKKRKEN